MILSHKGKFIFFHIPRTGGTSVLYNLREYLDVDSSIAVPDEYGTNMWRRKLHTDQRTHSTYIEAKRKYKEYFNYFKFAFVRNPWDRAFSNFIGHMREYSPNRQITPDLFECYIRDKLCGKGVPPQYTYICDHTKNVSIDFVGRFENWEYDFNKTVSHLKLSKIESVHINRSDASHLDYHDYYTDAGRQMVEGYNKKDIELFGYEF